MKTLEFLELLVLAIGIPALIFIGIPFAMAALVGWLMRLFA